MSKLLTYKVGCLIEAAKNREIDIIGHGCNCFNTMGSGIAPLMAKAFPAMYAADQATIKGDINKLGSYSVAIINFTTDDIGELGSYSVGFTPPPAPSWSGVVIGVNIYSQYNYTGRRLGKIDLDYGALRNALKEINKDLYSIMIETDVLSLKFGLPKIGAGLAGGDWCIIEKIIKEELCDRGIGVTIYVLNENEIPEGGIIV